MDPSVGSERREAEDARERVAEGRLEVRWGNYRWSPRGGRGGRGGAAASRGVDRMRAGRSLGRGEESSTAVTLFLYREGS